MATAVFFTTGVITNSIVHKAELAHISHGSWAFLPFSSAILLAEAIPIAIELSLAVYGVCGGNPSLTCTATKVQTVDFSDWIRCSKARSQSTNPQYRHRIFPLCSCPPAWHLDSTAASRLLLGAPFRVLGSFRPDPLMARGRGDPPLDCPLPHRCRNSEKQCCSQQYWNPAKWLIQRAPPRFLHGSLGPSPAPWGQLVNTQQYPNHATPSRWCRVIRNRLGSRRRMP